jgi:Holliday junction resolvasome RuvABC endonuclease subunit
MSFLIALDPSSTNVGYCVVRDGEVVTSGTFTPDNHGDNADAAADCRTMQIILWANDLFQAYPPAVLAMETPAGNHGNRRTDRLLGRVWGALESAAIITAQQTYTEPPRIIAVYPTQVKSTKASKDNPRYAAAVVGKRKVGPDQADAIGVWLYAESLLRIAELQG